MDYTQFALFSDLDGTLFGPNRQVSPENLAALAQFRAGGGLFGVSTGRSPVNLRDMLPPGITNTWSVVLNGAMAYDFATGQAALTQALAHMDSFVRWVLAAYPAVNVLLCTQSQMFFLSDPGRADPDFLASHQPCVLGWPPAGEAWLKLLLSGPPQALAAIAARAVPADWVYSSPTYLEFLPRGVNKGRCLSALGQLPALKGRTIVAVGDWNNDLALLAAADIPAAVANALPEVQAMAKLHLPDCSQHAIAWLIDRALPNLPPE